MQTGKRASMRELHQVTLAAIDGVTRVDAHLQHTDERVTKAETVIGATFASLSEFCGRSLMGRLRWLLTGR